MKIKVVVARYWNKKRNIGDQMRLQAVLDEEITTFLEENNEFETVEIYQSWARDKGADIALVTIFCK